MDTRRNNHVHRNIQSGIDNDPTYYNEFDFNSAEENEDSLYMEGIGITSNYGNVSHYRNNGYLKDQEKRKLTSPDNALLPALRNKGQFDSRRKSLTQADLNDAPKRTISLDERRLSWNIRKIRKEHTHLYISQARKETRSKSLCNMDRKQGNRQRKVGWLGSLKLQGSIDVMKETTEEGNMVRYYFQLLNFIIC